MGVLDTEEQAVVEVVREFVDREVRPVARDLEHTDTYPDTYPRRSGGRRDRAGAAS